MAREIQPNSVLEQIHCRELGQFKDVVGAGNPLGAPAALYYCCENGPSAPPWLIKAALDLICDLLKREKPINRGRTAGTIARHRQDMIDLTRWNEVIVLREKQTMVRQSLRDYPEEPTCPRYRTAKHRAEWLGTSMWTVFECVSEMLERTEAFGSPETIRRSYQKVERNMKHYRDALSYSQLDPLFLRMLGIDIDRDYMHNVKLKHFGPEGCRSDVRSRRSVRRR
jgi:hypothetical protein